MAVNGWRDHVGEAEYGKIVKLGEGDGPCKGVTLDWQANQNLGLQEELRDVLGTMLDLDTIQDNTGTPSVRKVAKEELERRYRHIIRLMHDAGYRLWLDYGYRDRTPGRRVIDDLKHFYEFRVRPEGKPVGVN